MRAFVVGQYAPVAHSNPRINRLGASNYIGVLKTNRLVRASGLSSSSTSGGGSGDATATTNSSSSAASTSPAAPASPEASLSSLDALLGGSAAEASSPTTAALSTAAAPPRRAAAPAVSPEPPVSSADLSGLSEPRTRPDISTAAYYLVLLVYASQYIVELAAGPEAADALRLNLANDHAAVASGDVLRLFTSAFASDTPRQLGVTLLCIFTVGSELESLVGSGVYWAVLCLSAVAGGLADAAFSPRPLTGGPGPIVAGLVAALLAYHVKNWAVEARLQQVKETRASLGLPPEAGAPPPSTIRARLSAMLESLAGGPPPRLMGGSDDDGDDTKSSSSKGSRGKITAFADDDAIVLAEELKEPKLTPTRVEVIDGLWAPTVLLPREAKAFTALAGAAAASVSAVLDASGARGDYTAIVAGFLFGGALGYAVAPCWRVRWELAAAEDGEDGDNSSSGSSSSGNNDTSSSSSSGGGWLSGVLSGGKGGKKGGASLKTLASAASADGVFWRARLADTATPAGRARAVTGAAAALYCAIGLWLLAN